MANKSAYIDCETGGFDYKKNALTQFAMIITVDGEIKDEIEMIIKPFPNDVIEDKALEVSGLTHEKIEEEGLEPEVALKKIIQVLGKYVDKYDEKDKLNFYGWNGRFDGNFVREFFSKNGFKYFGSYFWTPPLDLMAIVMYELQGERRKIVNAKLSSVAKYLGIDIKKYKLHSAIDDVKLMMDVEIALIERKKSKATKSKSKAKK